MPLRNLTEELLLTGARVRDDRINGLRDDEAAILRPFEGGARQREPIVSLPRDGRSQTFPAKIYLGRRHRAARRT